MTVASPPSVRQPESDLHIPCWWISSTIGTIAQRIRAPLCSKPAVRFWVNQIHQHQFGYCFDHVEKIINENLLPSAAIEITREEYIAREVMEI